MHKQSVRALLALLIVSTGSTHPRMNFNGCCTWPKVMPGELVHRHLVPFLQLNASVPSIHAPHRIRHRLKEVSSLAEAVLLTEPQDPTNVL